MRVILVSIATVKSTFKKVPIGTSTPILLGALDKRLFITAQFNTCRKKPKESNIKVNDIVTVLDENQKRIKWQLGKVE